MRVTDIRHFLDDTGKIPEDLPKPAYLMVLQSLAIAIEASKRCRGTEAVRLAPPCTRKPGRKRCLGWLYAKFSTVDALAIMWECSGCGDSEIVSGWQDVPASTRLTTRLDARRGRNSHGLRALDAVWVSDLMGLSVLRPNDLYEFVKLQYELCRMFERQKPNSGSSMLTVRGLTLAFASFVDSADSDLASQVRNVLSKAGLPMDASIRGDSDPI